MMNPAEFAHIAAAEQDFWWYRGMRRILFRLLDPIAGSRVFKRVGEAGCGTGYLARQLTERYGWQMFPLDLGWEGLAYARKFGVARLVQGDIRRLPYAAGAFDLVLSMDVLVPLTARRRIRRAGRVRTLARARRHRRDPRVSA